MDGLSHPDDAEEEYLDDVEVGRMISRVELSISSLDQDLSPEERSQKECGWEYGGGMLRLPDQMQRRV